MTSSRVMVTGANGFVGRFVCARLVDKGFSVRAVVRNRADSGLPVAADLARIEDISPATNWAPLLDGIEVVVHLAARAHVLQETATDPLSEFRRVNVAGTERLARCAASCGVRRFVYMSSAGVHGARSGAHGFSESDDPAPHDDYSRSKWEGEEVVRSVAGATALEAVVLRPPLVYGPSAPGNFARLIAAINRGAPLPLASVGNKRSLIFVGNLADAVTQCVRHGAAAQQTYLVSDGEDLSTPELARRIALSLGRPARLLPMPTSFLRLAGKLSRRQRTIERLVDSLVIDSSKIRSELEWVAPYSMTEALEITASAFLEQASG